MKKRNETTVLYENNIVKINQEKNKDLFFEIKNEITTDVAEAVAIMMRMNVTDVWYLNIDFNNDSIIPYKCLYWLSGGSKEWITLEHYCKPWSECYKIFDEEFGSSVLNIINKSDSLNDIRNGFRRYLNLPVMYDFALEKNLIK